MGGLENLNKMHPCHCWGFTVAYACVAGCRPGGFRCPRHLLLPGWGCSLNTVLCSRFSGHTTQPAPPPKKFCNSILKFIICKSALWDCKSHCPWKDKYHLKMRNGTQLLFLNLRYLIKSWKLDSRVIYSHAVFWRRWTAGAGGRCFHK